MNLARPAMRWLLPVVVLVAPLAACTAGTQTAEQAYPVGGEVTTLVIDARAAAVTVTAGGGPATVTESYRYAGSKPRTAHTVTAGTLTLTEKGCGDADVRCEVRYRIVVPATTRAEVSTRAGTVRIDGLAGDVAVRTRAGAVEGRALRGDRVTVSTEAGAASLEFTEAPSLVRAGTEVGAVEVRVPGDAAYAVAVDTGVGRSEVSVRRDVASAHRIEVRSRVGAVSIVPTAS